jgi:hypothetical protein
MNTSLVLGDLITRETIFEIPLGHCYAILKEERYIHVAA